MSGEVNKVSIAQLQARLLELSSQNTPEARAEIKKCKAQIGELLKGAGKVETAGGELSISEEMGFRQNNKVANDETQKQMGEYARDGAGSKDAAKANIKKEFGEGALDDAIRHSISKLSYLHCTSCETYRKRVIQLGEEPDRVYNVGAIGIDNVRKMSLLSKKELAEQLGCAIAESDYAVVTFHPETLNNSNVNL